VARDVVAVVTQPGTLTTHRSTFVAFHLARASASQQNILWNGEWTTHRHVQQPVLDRGGKRERRGTVGPLRLELAEEEWSSLGAITGRRSGGLLGASPLLSSCITKVVAVLMGEDVADRFKEPAARRAQRRISERMH
jgi:hypothetical protein